MNDSASNEADVQRRMVCTRPPARLPARPPARPHARMHAHNVCNAHNACNVCNACNARNCMPSLARLLAHGSCMYTLTRACAHVCMRAHTHTLDGSVRTKSSSTTFASSSHRTALRSSRRHAPFGTQRPTAIDMCLDARVDMCINACWACATYRPKALAEAVTFEYPHNHTCMIGMPSAMPI